MFSYVKIGKIDNFDFSLPGSEKFVKFTLLFRRCGAEKFFWIFLVFPLDKHNQSDNITVQKKKPPRTAAKNFCNKKGVFMSFRPAASRIIYCVNRRQVDLPTVPSSRNFILEIGPRRYSKALVAPALTFYIRR